jgi:hypothetical protein
MCPLLCNKNVEHSKVSRMTDWAPVHVEIYWNSSRLFCSYLASWRLLLWNAVNSLTVWAGSGLGYVGLYNLCSKNINYRHTLPKSLFCNTLRFTVFKRYLNVTFVYARSKWKLSKIIDKKSQLICVCLYIYIYRERERDRERERC